MEITLRPLRAADADVISAWFAGPAELAQWAGPETDFPLTRSHLETWIGERAGPRPRTCYAAVDADDMPFATFQLVDDRRNRMVRLARFGVAPERRGRGLGRALLKLILERAFVEMGAHRVELGVSSENSRARELYERAGFVHEGTARDSSLVDGAWRSVDNMSLLRPEWRRGWADAVPAMAG
ncbi:MAG TPA: GNAT family protein [Bauldia sp.]|nr:GNAT family protein [Bauldia sp.]